jgi:GAF domain-containing protein
MLQAGDALQPVAHRSTDAQRMSQTPLQVEAPPQVQEVLLQQRPIIVPDTNEEPYWQRMLKGENIRCWMGVPLVVQDRVIGLLNLNSERPRAYTARDAELAAAFATQSATAIRNARLFDDLQRSHAALAVPA